MSKLELTFNSYTYVNAPEGVFLLFPAVARQGSKRQIGDAGVPVIKRVTIEIVEFSDLDEIGYVSDDGLRIDLDREQFTTLRRNLAKRDVRYSPVVIQTKLGERGLLSQLIIDGQTLVPSNRSRQSDVKELAG